jgi:hypothetical protein
VRRNRNSVSPAVRVAYIRLAGGCIAPCITLITPNNP